MLKAQSQTGSGTTRFQSLFARRKSILSVLLIAVTLAVYTQVWRFGFVPIDDQHYVMNNPHVHDGLSLSGLRWAWNCQFSNWMPLTWLSFMLDGTLYDDWAGGYHVTNVLLHLANVLLVFAFLSRATGNELPSAFVAALFAVHPLHVESVAWISERKDVLSMLFGLMSLCAYVNYVQRQRKMHLAAAWGWFVASLLAKQTFVTLPCLLLLLDYWPLGRLRRDAFDRSPLSRTVARLVVEKSPFFLVSAIFCGIAFWAQQRGGSVNILDDLSWWNRAGNAILAYGLYLRKALLPYDLAVFYPHPGTAINWWQVGLSFWMLAACTWIAVAQRRRRPFLLVGWLWAEIFRRTTISADRRGRGLPGLRQVGLPSGELLGRRRLPDAAHAGHD
jgi:hypothetical protein